jgi:predicted site-specific integrase-resolvase
MDDDAFYTTNEAADVLGLCPQTLNNWRRKGTGPTFITLGTRSIRYSKESVDFWKGLMTTAEVSEMLKVSVATVAQWRRRKVGPEVHNTNRPVRYLRDKVVEWAAKQTSVKSTRGRKKKAA